MRARLFAVAVSGLLMLPLAACASSDPSPGATGRAEPAPGVCDGVPKCRVVANTDVDGDGRPDPVGFVVESEKRVVVRGTTVRSARFMASRVVALVEHPAGEDHRQPDHSGRRAQGE